MWPRFSNVTRRVLIKLYAKTNFRGPNLFLILVTDSRKIFVDNRKIIVDEYAELLYGIGRCCRGM